jgi:hypothetical protein
MRPITIILGSVAGFFMFAGIGLILRGYQWEGLFTLVIGVLNLVQFIRFMKAESS